MEVEAPKLYCDVLENLDNGYKFTNKTKVSGSYKEEGTEDEDEWTTIVYNKEPEKEGFAYITKRLNHIEILMEHMSLRLLKIEKRSNIRELIVREYNGKTFITDLGTGENTEVKVISQEEYDEYINRRFGITSKLCEDQKTHRDRSHDQQ